MVQSEAQQRAKRNYHAKIMANPEYRQRKSQNASKITLKNTRRMIPLGKICLNINFGNIIMMMLKRRQLKQFDVYFDLMNYRGSRGLYYLREGVRFFRNIFIL
jgi:hypothetical protein